MSCALCEDYGVGLRRDTPCPFVNGEQEQWEPARLQCGSKVTIDFAHTSGAPVTVNRWELCCTVDPEPPLPPRTAQEAEATALGSCTEMMAAYYAAMHSGVVE